MAGKLYTAPNYTYSWTPRRAQLCTIANLPPQKLTMLSLSPCSSVHSISEPCLKTYRLSVCSLSFWGTHVPYGEKPLWGKKKGKKKKDPHPCGRLQIKMNSGEEYITWHLGTLLCPTNTLLSRQK